MSLYRHSDKEHVWFISKTPVTDSLHSNLPGFPNQKEFDDLVSDVELPVIDAKQFLPDDILNAESYLTDEQMEVFKAKQVEAQNAQVEKFKSVKSDFKWFMFTYDKKPYYGAIIKFRDHK